MIKFTYKDKTYIVSFRSGYNDRCYLNLQAQDWPYAKEVSFTTTKGSAWSHKHIDIRSLCNDIPMDICRKAISVYVNKNRNDFKIWAEKPSIGGFIKGLELLRS